MVTQALIERNAAESVIIWLRHENRDGVFVRPGKLVQISGEPGHWFVKQVFGEYSDSVQLPPKAREATITAVI